MVRKRFLPGGPRGMRAFSVKRPTAASAGAGSESPPQLGVDVMTRQIIGRPGTHKAGRRTASRWQTLDPPGSQSLEPPPGKSSGRPGGTGCSCLRLPDDLVPAARRSGAAANSRVTRFASGPSSRLPRAVNHPPRNPPARGLAQIAPGHKQDCGAPHGRRAGVRPRGHVRRREACRGTCGSGRNVASAVFAGPAVCAPTVCGSAGISASGRSAAWPGTSRGPSGTSDRQA